MNSAGGHAEHGNVALGKTFCTTREAMACSGSVTSTWNEPSGFSSNAEILGLLDVVAFKFRKQIQGLTRSRSKDS